jgi:hypothetical protein
MPFLSLQSNFIDQAQAAFLYNYEQKYRHKGPDTINAQHNISKLVMLCLYQL